MLQRSLLLSPCLSCPDIRFQSDSPCQDGAFGAVDGCSICIVPYYDDDTIREKLVQSSVLRQIQHVWTRWRPFEAHCLLRINAAHRLNLSFLVVEWRLNEKTFCHVKEVLGTAVQGMVTVNLLPFEGSEGLQDNGSVTDVQVVARLERIEISTKVSLR